MLGLEVVEIFTLEVGGRRNIHTILFHMSHAGVEGKGDTYVCLTVER